jgi:UDP-glucose 4-epimerase
VKVLVTGIAGELGRMVAARMIEAGHQVVGIDRRPWERPPAGVEVHAVDVRTRAAEDVFRTRRPDCLIHMATIAPLMGGDLEERYRVNLGGTRAVFEHAKKYRVKQAIFVGRHTVYGAAHDAPLYFTEADPPLGGATFPELADLVAADLFAASALWRWPEMDTSVLRFCYTLGPSRRGTLAAFLSGKRVPTVLGFDPLFQLLHESDAARAIAAVVGHGLRGVFNVAGPPPIPLSLLIKKAGRTRVMVPEPVLAALLGRFGLPGLPRGAISHIKYPVVVDDALFRKTTGFAHEIDETKLLAEYSRIAPPGRRRA